jgi:hypothetical protein
MDDWMGMINLGLGAMDGALRRDGIHVSFSFFLFLSFFSS